MGAPTHITTDREGRTATLAGFRAEHPPRTWTIEGMPWRYLAMGTGDQTLVSLTGALGIADLGWYQLEQLAQRFRLIAPDYPPVHSMAALADGIAAIMDHEGISRAAVQGGSYGGMLAQVLVRRHPARVDRLILSHTGPPAPDSGRKLQRLLPLLRILPGGMLRGLLKRSLSRLEPPEDAQDVERYYAPYREAMDRISKPDILAMYLRAVDYLTNYSFTAQDLAGWGSRVLIMLAEDDPATPEPVREELVRLYPGAQVKLFQGTGHAAALLKQEEYTATIEGFLA